jgi:hypothetical protein
MNSFNKKTSKELLLLIYKKPIPKLKIAYLNLEFGIINEFLIIENSSEILIDLRLKLVLG